MSVARQLRGTSQETLAPWDITPAHLRALRTLRRHGTMRLSELSDHLHIAPRSTTEVVDAMEARDLVRRDRKSTRLNSSHVAISYAVFCLKKKNKITFLIYFRKKKKKTSIN